MRPAVHAYAGRTPVLGEQVALPTTRTARQALPFATGLALRRSGSEGLLARLELAHLDRFAVAETDHRRGFVRPVRSVDRVRDRDEDILTRIDRLDLRAIDSLSSSLSEDSE